MLETTVVKKMGAYQKVIARKNSTHDAVSQDVRANETHNSLGTLVDRTEESPRIRLPPVVSLGGATPRKI
jgi:hypothetical protein